ncbi:unnamed protein product [Rhizophagus irregularis]|nr:unnamed protein product [Rhizophagus irregularis]
MTRTKRFIISLIVKVEFEIQRIISLGHTNLLLIVKIFSVIHSLRFISTPQENDTEEEYDDHDKAKEQLIETITWRDLEAGNGVPENILRIYEYFGGNSVHKTDKEGREFTLKERDIMIPKG